MRDRGHWYTYLRTIRITSIKNHIKRNETREPQTESVELKTREIETINRAQRTTSKREVGFDEGVEKIFNRTTMIPIKAKNIVYLVRESNQTIH